MVLSDYGEDPIRPLVYLVILTVLSTLYWSALFWPVLSALWGLLNYVFFNSIIIPILTVQNTTDSLAAINTISTSGILEIKITTNTSRIIEASERTLFNLVGFRQEGKLADFVVTAISYPLLGILFISLRRRYERRFRH
jgi:hypothetical protein